MTARSAPMRAVGMRYQATSGEHWEDLVCGHAIVADKLQPFKKRRRCLGCLVEAAEEVAHSELPPVERPF